MSKYMGYKKEEQEKVVVNLKTGTLILYGVAENIIRSIYTREEEKTGSPIGIERSGGARLTVTEQEEALCVSTDELIMELDKKTGRVIWRDKKTKNILLKEADKELRKVPEVIYSLEGEAPVINRVKTVDGERNFIENLRPVERGYLYKAKLSFDFMKDEQIHGLGQGEEGIYDYRHHNQYLYQHNMKIPMPFFVSSKGYGILVDTTSLLTFNDDERGSYIYADAIDQLDYYFVAGSVDKVIDGYRKLTGTAVMLPKYAFGYVQSKEAYHTQEEVLEVAKRYREQQVPIDLIVQDWNTWEDGKWGNKKVDKKRYPDLKEMNKELHQMNVHSMVSVWPNMNYGCENYVEMEDGRFLLNDLATYDAFNEKARELYFAQMYEELFSGGFDSWWCDSTEPFSGPDWNGEYLREPWERFSLVGDEHKKFLGAKKANYYATMHAKGIYENQRKVTDKKRVLNLTRSGYASIQKYGTVLWSGDIMAKWKVFKKQIVEGLNVSMSGIPYWTLDIGAFFTVNENWKHRGCGCNNDPSPKWFWKGDYEEGVEDPAYRELYVRWFEYGAFLPMFRSHGTDTPREVWNFGKPGEPYYDALIKTIKMRYRLMPYIYSLAGSVTFYNDTIMRSLLFDFSQDEEAIKRSDEYMFGRNLLICPITDPMEEKSFSTRECYLPKGSTWYCFYTNKEFLGGAKIDVSVPIDQIPVFVKSGSIIPMEADLTYANQRSKKAFEIHIYPGEDGEFLYYEDEGDGYGYETGSYNFIAMNYNEKDKTLTIGKSKTELPNGLAGRECKIFMGKEVKTFRYSGKEEVICL